VAERLEVLFGEKTLGGLKNIVLDGDPDTTTARKRSGKIALVRCDLRQITLASLVIIIIFLLVRQSARQNLVGFRLGLGLVLGLG